MCQVVIHLLLEELSIHTGIIELGKEKSGLHKSSC